MSLCLSVSLSVCLVFDWGPLNWCDSHCLEEKKKVIPFSDPILHFHHYFGAAMNINICAVCVISHSSAVVCRCMIGSVTVVTVTEPEQLNHTGSLHRSGTFCCCSTRGQHVYAHNHPYIHPTRLRHGGVVVGVNYGPTLSIMNTMGSPGFTPAIMMLWQRLIHLSVHT